MKTPYPIRAVWLLRRDNTTGTVCGIILRHTQSFREETEVHIWALSRLKILSPILYVTKVVNTAIEGLALTKFAPIYSTRSPRRIQSKTAHTSLSRKSESWQTLRILKTPWRRR